MPTYSFVNNETGETEEHFLKISELDLFKESNPHLTQSLNVGTIIGGRSTDSGRLPEGFKDRLRDMKAKHPNAKGLNDYI